MTDLDRARLSAYLRTLADRMGLRDWTAEVLDEPADADCYAVVRFVDGRKLGKARFAHNWTDDPPEVLRNTCCHELIHFHLEPTVAEMRRRLSKANFDTFIMLLEYAVDGIADAWAPCLPLMLSVHHEGGSPMGQQKTKVPAAAKAPQPRPKAGPKPQPKGKGKTPAKAGKG